MNVLKYSATAAFVGGTYYAIIGNQMAANVCWRAALDLWCCRISVSSVHLLY